MTTLCRVLHLERSRSYVTVEDMKQQGGVFLRPWHLVYTPESGVKGLVEQESCLNTCLAEWCLLQALLLICSRQDLHLQLCQLVLAHGFLECLYGHIVDAW